MPTDSVNTQVSDFEAAIEIAADALVLECKQAFKGGVEPFELQATKIRQEMHDTMHRFHDNLQRGYEAVGIWLETEGISCPKLSGDAMLILQDPEHFFEAANSGSQIFQVLGFTDEDMALFYKAAHGYVLGDDFEKGRDSFYFLVTIAPAVGDFWLGLAISLGILKEYKQALDATLHAIELDPTKIERYHNALYLYVQLNDTENAKALCKHGIDFAKAHEREPWAKALSAALQQAAATIKKYPHGAR